MKFSGKDCAGQPVGSCPVTEIIPGVVTTIAGVFVCPSDHTRFVNVPIVLTVIGPLHKLSELGEYVNGISTLLASVIVHVGEVAVPQDVITVT
jgi:hypothetical protein